MRSRGRTTAWVWIAIAIGLDGVGLIAQAEPQPAAALPFAVNDPDLEARFRTGRELETAGDYLGAVRIYEALAEQMPRESHLAWRIGRAYYLHARTLPIDAKAKRMEYFNLTHEWAKRGSEVDPSCAECALYEFVGMSRVATTKGILSSARHAKEMAALLDRAMALGPTHTDADWNSELANLYYAAGVFYRSLPTSSVIAWTIGVKGDRSRSIEYLRKANEITDSRIDYHIELGASLLCAGVEASDEALVAEGRQVLERLGSLPEVQPSDALDKQAAPFLSAHTDQACDYSREAMLGVE